MSHKIQLFSKTAQGDAKQHFKSRNMLINEVEKRKNSNEIPSRMQYFKISIMKKTEHGNRYQKISKIRYAKKSLYRRIFREISNEE